MTNSRFIIQQLADALELSDSIEFFGSMIAEARAYLAEPQPTRAEIEAAAVEEASNDLNFVVPSNMKLTSFVFYELQALAKQALLDWAAQRRAGGTF